MKSWLKWGLIGGGIGIIQLIVASMSCTVIKIVALDGSVPGKSLLCKVSSIFIESFLDKVHLIISNIFINILSVIITYFILGALVGILIEKFRNKNKS